MGPRRAAALIAALVTVALTACSKGGSPRLEGRWKGAFVEGVPPEQQAAATSFAKTMEIEARGDLITVTTSQEKQSGKFVVDSEDKISITLHTERDGVEDRQTFVFHGDKVMKWTVMDGKTPTITFVRDDPPK